MLELIVNIIIIINFYLLLFTKKNMYTWYLYNLIAAILPIIQVVVLTKKEKKTWFYSLNIIALYVISIFFFFITFVSIFLKDVLKAIN